MLCSRMLKRARDGQPAASTASSSASSTRCCAFYERTLRRGAAITAHRAVGVSLAIAGRRPSVLFIDRAEGLHLRRRHRPAHRDHRGGAGHLVRRDGRSSSRLRARHRGADPNVDVARSSARRRRAARGLNNGRMFVPLKPRDERPSADAVIQELRPKTAPASPALNVYVQNLPAIRIGGHVDARASTSTPCSMRTPTSC